MKNTILFFLLLAAITANAQRYRITPQKLCGWGALAIAGAYDGAVEGYEFDGRRSFERKFGASKTGFFGSESWRSAYAGGLPENGFKNDIVRHTGAVDFYHIADDYRKFGYITGGVTIGIFGAKTNTKWWHYALDFGIGFAVSGVTKNLAMQWIRN